MPEVLSLAGLSVAVTRPLGQGDALVQRLQSAGAQAVSIPLLAIAPLTDEAAKQRVADCLQQLARVDVAIFVSRNAAEQLLAALAAHGIAWPEHIASIAVGSPTAQFLREHGIAAISPARMDSEGMLAMPALQTAQGKHCVIFRGCGGREKTAQTLRERGTSVDYCELYQRVLPDGAAAAWAAWINEDTAQKLACINSVETLQHLLQIDHHAAARANLALVVPGTRVTERAQHEGFAQLCTAVNATDDCIFQTITHWYSL